MNSYWSLGFKRYIIFYEFGTCIKFLGSDIFLTFKISESECFENIPEFFRAFSFLSDIFFEKTGGSSKLFF